MSRICAIIAGGEFSPLCSIESADFVIACDKGYGYAKDFGIIPDLIIGDFDSYKGDIPCGIPTTVLPYEKDETDTMAAISYAAKNGFDTVFLYCALGGRLDHLLGNLQAAAYAAKSGLTVRITGQNDEIYVISRSEIAITKRKNCSISLISLTDKCENVCVSGAKYPLENAILTNASTLGISNEWENDITVSVGNGVLAIVMSKTM